MSSLFYLLFQGRLLLILEKKIIAYARKLSRVNIFSSLHSPTYIENTKYIKNENGAVSRSNPIGDLEIEFYFYPLHLIHWSISSLHLILNAQDKQTFYIIWKFSPIFFIQNSLVQYKRLFFLSQKLWNKIVIFLYSFFEELCASVLLNKIRMKWFIGSSLQ